MPDNASCIDKARLDVRRLQPRVAFQDRFCAVSRGEHPDNVLDGEPTATNDRLPAEELRVDRDASEEFFLRWGLVRHVQVSTWMSITLVIYGRYP